MKNPCPLKVAGLFPLVLHSRPWFGVVTRTMDATIPRLTGRIALILVPADAFGLTNEKKTQESEGPCAEVKAYPGGR